MLVGSEKEPTYSILAGSGPLLLTRGRDETQAYAFPISPHTSPMSHLYLPISRQDYAFRVRAIGSPMGPSPWSDATSVLNNYANVPTIPLNVATNASERGVEVVWEVAAVEKNEGAEYDVRLSCEQELTMWN